MKESQFFWMWEYAFHIKCIGDDRMRTTGSWKKNFSVSLWILCKEINCLYYFCSNINIIISGDTIGKDKWYLFWENEYILEKR